MMLIKVHMWSGDLIKCHYCVMLHFRHVTSNLHCPKIQKRCSSNDEKHTLFQIVDKNEL